mgnify:CR=1 FL=1
MGEEVQVRFEALRAVFSTKEIEWRVGDRRENGTQGRALPYVTARAVQDRLDATVGPANWRVRYREVVAGPVLLGISACLELRVGGEWIGKEDGSGTRQELADRNVQVKGAYSDALKRAAVQWGVGRYLYDMPELWLPLNDNGEFAVKPKLPAEFVLDVEKQAYFGVPYEAVTAQPLPEPGAELSAGAEVPEVATIAPYVLTSQKSKDGRFYLVEGMTQAERDNFEATLEAINTGKATMGAVRAFCEKADKQEARHTKWGVAGSAYVYDIVSGKVNPLAG